MRGLVEDFILAWQCVKDQLLTSSTFCFLLSCWMQDLMLLRVIIKACGSSFYSNVDNYDLSILSDFPVSDVVFSYSIANYRGTDPGPQGVLSEDPQCRAASGHAASHIPRPGTLLLWSALLSPEKTKQFPAGVLQGEKGQVSLHNYLRDF